MPSVVSLLHCGFSSTTVLVAGMRLYPAPLLGAAQNSCGILAGSLSSTTQQVDCCPLMVATALVWPSAPGLLPWQSSMRWERLQEEVPALLLPWDSPEVACTTVQPAGNMERTAGREQ